MKIRMTIGDKIVAATLADNAAARDLLAQLPLTLTLKDYNSTEKIAHPPKKLSTKGAPDGFTPVAGDIAYYAPWGNLAVFYKGFAYSEGLVFLGKIEGDPSALAASDAQKVLIEQVSPPPLKKTE